MSVSIRCGRGWWRALRTGSGRARAHLRDRDDGITARGPVKRMFPDLAGLLSAPPEDEDALLARLRAAESIGRPIGSDRFLARIEKLTGRVLKPAKRGPKPAEEA